MDGAMCRSNAECWKFGSKQQQKVAGKLSTDGKMQKDIKDNFLKSIRKKWSGFVFYILCFTSPVWLL